MLIVILVVMLFLTLSAAFINLYFVLTALCRIKKYDYDTEYSAIKSRFYCQHLQKNKCNHFQLVTKQEVRGILDNTRV